jgi:hypothetical protein
MPDTAADRKLASAVIQALEQREYGHPALHVRAVEILLGEKLSQVLEARGDALSVADFASLAEEAAVAAHNKADAPGEIVRTLVDGYRLFVREGEVLRPRRGGLVDAPWLGIEAVLGPRRRGALAHLHILAFPEIVAVLEQFAPPGRQRTVVVDSLKDRFVYGRKVNSVVAGFLVRAAREYGMIESVGQGDEGYRTCWAPPPAAAAVVVRSYLMLTGHAVDVAHDTSDVATQASFVLPRSFLARHPADAPWLRELGAPPDVIRREVGGASLRIDLEGLSWFAGAGLVSPLDCARVLRVRRAKDSLGRLREHLLVRMARLTDPPVNAAEIEAELQLG